MTRARYLVKYRLWMASLAGRICFGAWETDSAHTSLRRAIGLTRYRGPGYQWAVFYRGQRVGTRAWDGKFCASPAFKRTRGVSKSRGRKR